MQKNPGDRKLGGWFLKFYPFFWLGRVVWFIWGYQCSNMDRPFWRRRFIAFPEDKQHLNSPSGSSFQSQLPLTVNALSLVSGSLGSVICDMFPVLPRLICSSISNIAHVKTGRSQKEVIKGKSHCRVLQGVELDSALYNSFISDLKVYIQLSIIKCVDDTEISRKVNDEANTVLTQHNLDCLVNWVQSNKMCFNIVYPNA